jgi:hypothetical protein
MEANIHLDARDHSYSVRLKRGDRVRFAHDVSRQAFGISPERWPADQGIEAGTEATVLSESNAGFRGIEAMLELDTGEWLTSVSTGHLQMT